MKILWNYLTNLLGSWQTSDWLLAAGLVVSLALGLHLIDASQASQLGSVLGGLVQSIAGVVAGVILVVKILRHQQRTELARYAALHSHVTTTDGRIAGYVGPHENCDHGLSSHSATFSADGDTGDCDDHKGA